MPGPVYAVVPTTYTSIPVPIPDDFLAPLPDPSVIKTEKINFANTPLREYRSCYAVVLDNVLSHDECAELIHMAEQSAGGHNLDKEVPNHGWRPAMVNAGAGREYLALDYRNSDRIIWDSKVIMQRLWARVQQDKDVAEHLAVLKERSSALGLYGGGRGERWVVAKPGLNERMRFLKYGPGQFFRPHCDGAYHTPDGLQQSYFTLHLYLNDSAQALEKEHSGMKALDTSPPSDEVLRGGATTFHSFDEKRRLDVDPKAGRVLIFQHASLYHSGDDVISGIKYTMRSDIMYEFEGGTDRGDDNIVFE